MKALILILLSLVIWRKHTKSVSCLHSNNTPGPYDEWGFPLDTLTVSNNIIRNADDELDLIYSLLTYSIVYKTWQIDADKAHPSRGHNYWSLARHSQK